VLSSRDPQDDALIAVIAEAITAEATQSNHLNDMRIAGAPRRASTADAFWADW
jgi:hypothetical protein